MNTKPFFKIVLAAFSFCFALFLQPILPISAETDNSRGPDWSGYSPLIDGSTAKYETPATIAITATGPAVFIQNQSEGLVCYQSNNGKWSKDALSGKMIGSAGADVDNDNIYLVHRGIDNAVYIKNEFPVSGPANGKQWVD